MTEPDENAVVDPPWIKCPECGAISYNPHDIEELYCPRCHWWTSDPEMVKVREILAEHGETPEPYGVAKEVSAEHLGYCSGAQKRQAQVNSQFPPLF